MEHCLEVIYWIREIQQIIFKQNLGISAMTREQYVKMNGFSNDFWGWGGEDDDVSTR